MAICCAERYAEIRMSFRGWDCVVAPNQYNAKSAKI
jgi:hypothetical protein